MSKLSATLCVAVAVVLVARIQSFRLGGPLVEKMSIDLIDLQPAKNLDPDVAWETYKAKFGKHYEGEEDKRKSAIFHARRLAVAKHNSEGHGFTMAINQFADWSHEELESHHGLNVAKRLVGVLGSSSSCSDTANSVQPLSTCNMTFLAPLNFVAPDTVDWRQHGLVTPAKAQGNCMSCYSFSTTGAVEGQHARKTGKLLSLSEQQIIDCSTPDGNEGCQGGFMDNGFRYIRDAGGLETEQSYAYIDREAPVKEKCKADPKKFAAKVTGCMDITSGDEEALKNAVASVGPVSVGVDALEDFSSYSDGIYSSSNCNNTFDALDHGILVVGYGTENGQDYWLIKNSWSKTWGQDGFGKIARNKGNMCGVATFASFPLV